MEPGLPLELVLITGAALLVVLIGVIWMVAGAASDSAGSTGEPPTTWQFEEPLAQPTEDHKSRMLSIEEAAAQLGVSVEEVQAMLQEGEIRGYARRGEWAFRPEDVLDAQRQ